MARAASLLLLAALQSFVHADAAVSTNATAYQSGELGLAPNQTFHSSPIVAPVFQVSLFNATAVDQTPYIFLATIYNGVAGPMIFSSKDLSLVYADQRWPGAFDARSQTLNGSNYLTFWEGVQSGGHANGYCGVYDQDYNLKWNLTALGFSDGVLADLHEFKFTDDGGALFTVYQNVPYDVSPVGGPKDGLLMDCLFQEIDVASNTIRFQWRASDHFPITASYGDYGPSFGVGNGTGFDYFHINAVSKTDEGNYLVSSRHLHMITLINGTDGTPIWILGGKLNQFTDISGGAATQFAWQHDARFHQNESIITFFDNHVLTTGSDTAGNFSRGMRLQIDTDKKTVMLLAEYFHPDGLQSGAMGSYQSLSSGNVFTGWGTNPTFAEFENNGTPVMNVHLAPLGNAANPLFVYRAYKMDWVGVPSWPPNIAAVPGPVANSTVNATVYVSWNGATEMKSWALLADNTTNNIDGPSKVIARANRTGFETAITFVGANATASARYARAAALAANGTILGSTPVVDLLTGLIIYVNGSVTQVVVLDAPAANATHTSTASISATATSTPSTSPTKDGGVGRVQAGILWTGLFAIGSVAFGTL